MPKARKTRSKKAAGLSFAEAVKSKLSETRKTLSGVAKEMGVPHARVRQWIARNKFPETGLLQLSARIGLTTDIAELKRTYGVEITTHGRIKPATLDVAETIRSFLGPRLPEPEEDGFGADVLRFLRSLDENEIFIVWGIDQLPFEMTNVGWRVVGNAVATAIYQKNIYCIYVHPNEDELRRLRDQCGLRNLPHIEFFEAAFKQFVRNLSLTDELKDLSTDEVLLESANGQRARLTNKQISEHVISVAAPCAAFCSPHHRYVVFVPANSTGKSPSALGRFPTGASKAVRPSLLPLEEETTFDLYDFLITCLKADGPHRNAEIVRDLAPLAGNPRTSEGGLVEEP